MLRTMLSHGIVCVVALLLPSATIAQEEPATKSPLDSPFLVEPKSPADLFEAAQISAKLARPALARQYIEKLLEVADDDALLEIREQFGAAELLRLAAIDSLHPASRTLLQRSNAAFRTQSEDPARVRGLIQNLTGTPSERAVALASLRAGGPNVVGSMLAVLADPSQVQLHEPITIAMTQLTSDAVPAIRAGIDSPNDQVKTSCLVALGYLGDRSVVPYLWHPAFAPGVPPGARSAARKSLQTLLSNSADRPQSITNIGASDDLYKDALTYLAGSNRWLTDVDGNITTWSWVNGNLTGTPTKPEAATERTGARLARDAMELDPTSLKKQALYLAFALASDSRKAGWDQPLPIGAGTAQDLGLSVGGELLSHTLEVALDQDNTDAARGALAAIWQVGGNELRSTVGPSQITRALSHRDQRIQFAAANAILNLSPGRDFAGSTQVVAVLSRALRSDGSVKCLVIDPNSDRGNATATLMSELGYQTTVAATGREGFRIAANRGDVSMVAVNANSVQWGLSQTIANLRADSRTSGLPIVIYGPQYAEAQLNTTLAQYDDITFIEETGETGEAARRFVNLRLKPFLESSLPKLSEAELTAQKALAADWFAQLAGPRRRSPLDLNIAQSALLEAAEEEPIARQCIAALGAIPNAGVQFRLQEFAINEGLPETTRLHAMNELAFHIQRNGIMLGVDEQLDVLKLAQALANTPLSTAAAALAGSMRPAARQTFKRLRRYQPRQ
jgi:CheY-like chemotaxis protein